MGYDEFGSACWDARTACPEHYREFFLLSVVHRLSLRVLDLPDGEQILAASLAAAIASELRSRPVASRTGDNR